MFGAITSRRAQYEHTPIANISTMIWSAWCTCGEPGDTAAAAGGAWGVRTNSSRAATQSMDVRQRRAAAAAAAADETQCRQQTRDCGEQ